MNEGLLRLAAPAWAAVLALLVSGCSASSDDDGGGAPSGGSGSSSGATASASAPATGSPGAPASSSPPAAAPVPGDLPGPPAPGQAPAAPAPNPPAVQPPGPPAPNQPPAPQAVVLDWLPIGPVGRGDPVWYVDLKGRNCTTAGDPLTATTMLELAPTLCLGLNGDEAEWESGAAALATIPPPTLATSDCWSVTAYEVLQNIASFRRQNPAVPFTLAPRRGTACPPDLKFLEDELRNSPPAPVCAGAAIVLVGTLEGLPAGSVRRVSVGTATAAVGFRNSTDDVNYPPGDLYFLAPPIEAVGPITVSVSVADADYPVQGTVPLDYADPQTCLPPSGNAP